jgi:hypothetical protein
MEKSVTVCATASAEYDLSRAGAELSANADSLVLATARIIEKMDNTELKEVLSKMSFDPVDTFSTQNNPNLATIRVDFERSFHGDYELWLKAAKYIFVELLFCFDIPSAVAHFSEKSEIIKQERRYQ